MSRRFSWLALLLAIYGGSASGCAKFQLSSKGLRNQPSSPKAATPPQQATSRGKPEEKTTNFAHKSTKHRSKSAVEQLERQLSSARLMERRGQIDAARSDYLLLVEKYPEHPLPHHRLGVMAAQDGKFEEAERLFQQAVACGDPTTDLLCDLGYTLYLQDRLPQAEQVLRDALARDGQHAQSRNNLGLVLGQIGRFEEALSCFRANGSGAEAHANMAYVHTQRNEVRLAQQHYLRALSLDPNMKSAAEALLQLSQIAPLPTPEEEQDRLAGKTKAPSVKSRVAKSRPAPRRAVAKATPQPAQEETLEAPADELLADSATNEAAEKQPEEPKAPEQKPKPEQAHAHAAPVHRTPYSWNNNAPQLTGEPTETPESTVAEAAKEIDKPQPSAPRRALANVKRTAKPSVQAALPRPVPKVTISPYSNEEIPVAAEPVPAAETIVQQPTPATEPVPTETATTSENVLTLPGSSPLPPPIAKVARQPVARQPVAPTEPTLVSEQLPKVVQTPAPRLQPQRVTVAPPRAVAIKDLPKVASEPTEAPASKPILEHRPAPSTDVAPALGLAGVKPKTVEPKVAAPAQQKQSEEPAQTTAKLAIPPRETREVVEQLPAVTPEVTGPKLSFPSAPARREEAAAPVVNKMTPRPAPEPSATLPNETVAPAPATQVASKPRSRNRYGEDGTPTATVSSTPTSVPTTRVPTPSVAAPVATTKPIEAPTIQAPANSEFRMRRPIAGSAAANVATTPSPLADKAVAGTTAARLPTTPAPSRQLGFGEPSLPEPQKTARIAVPRPLPTVQDSPALPENELPRTTPRVAAAPQPLPMMRREPATIQSPRMASTNATSSSALNEAPTREPAPTIDRLDRLPMASTTEHDHNSLRLSTTDTDVSSHEPVATPAPRQIAISPTPVGGSKIGFAPLPEEDSLPDEEAVPQQSENALVVKRPSTAPQRMAMPEGPAQVTRPRTAVAARSRQPLPMARTASLPPRRMAPVVHAPPAADDSTPGFAIATDGDIQPAPPANNFRR